MQKPRYSWLGKETISSKKTIEEELGRLPSAFQLLVNFSNFVELAEVCPHRKIDGNSKLICAYKNNSAGCCAFDFCPEIKRMRKIQSR
jgi:hypothetical protein